MLFLTCLLRNGFLYIISTKIFSLQTNKLKCYQKYLLFIMRKLITFIAACLIVSSQLYAQLLIDPDDLGMAVEVVKVGRDTVEVPHGKIWLTKENRNITMYLADETLKYYSPCANAYKKDTRVLFGLHVERPYEEKKYFGVIFTKKKPDPFKGGNAIRFVPSSFVTEDFNRSLLSVMVPRMLGRPEIKFKPGTVLYTDSCIEAIVFYQINMPYDEIPIYDSLQEIKRLEWERYQAELERLRILQHENQLRKKISEEYTFPLKELDILPKLTTGEKGLIDFYKKIYEHNVEVKFVIHEDGQIEVFSSVPQNIDRKLYRKYFRFEPGKVMIQEKPVPVKTMVHIIFAPEGIQTKDGTVREMKVRKKRKPPYAKIRRYPEDLFTEQKLKKLIDFNDVVKNDDIGALFFRLWYNEMHLTTYYKADIKDTILVDKDIEKFKYKYRRRNGEWKH
jgi:hypothetical protein